MSKRGEAKFFVFAPFFVIPVPCHSVQLLTLALFWVVSCRPGLLNIPNAVFSLQAICKQKLPLNAEFGLPPSVTPSRQGNRTLLDSGTTLAPHFLTGLTLGPMDRLNLVDTHRRGLL